MKKKEYKGFIAPTITSDHWILGGSNAPLTILQADSNWISLLPQNEFQNIRDIETFNCTGFGTTNAIELLMYRLFNERVNYSDRWVAIISGTKNPGNDPHVVAEAIRKNGLIPEEMLPFSDDIKNDDEYLSFKGANEEACRQAGKDWLNKYQFNHEWCYRENQPLEEKINNMKVGLKSSPLCLAVYAWASDNRNVYISMGDPNHWTTLYNVEQFLEIFDSYDPFRKLLDQNILYCKRYSIVRLTDIKEELNFIEKQIAKLAIAIKNFIDGLKKKPEAVIVDPYKEVKEAIKDSKIVKWAKAIERWEGSKPELNNPGNLKFSPLTVTWGAMPGFKAKDGGYIAKFETYDKGFKALCEFLTLGCKDELKAFHKTRTFEAFTKVYAGNPPLSYILGIALILGCPLDTDIKTFLI